MGKAFEQADIQRQISGMELAGQEQSRLAGMAGGLAQQGLSDQAANVGIQQQNFGNQMGVAGMMSGLVGQQAGMAQQDFSNQLGLQNQSFNQGFNTTNQRFMNAMNIFGGGMQQQGQNLANYQANSNAMLGQQSNLLNYGAQQQNQQQNQLQGALSSMGLGANIGNMDIQNLMQAMGLSGQLSSARSGANSQAYMPQLQAQVAQNDTNASNLQGIVGALGGLFGQQSPATPGINPNAPSPKMDPRTIFNSGFIGPRY
jgi:hypothetical protein